LTGPGRTGWQLHMTIIAKGKQCAACVDLAGLVGRTCENEWAALGGSADRLALHLDEFPLAVDRCALIVEGLTSLLQEGMSPGFSAQHGSIGVHLWIPAGAPIGAVLLIADDCRDIINEPVTSGTAYAYQCARAAGCNLTWAGGRGAVWRMHIPADDADYTCDSSESLSPWRALPIAYSADGRKRLEQAATR
jgi:hypothetical protein